MFPGPNQCFLALVIMSDAQTFHPLHYLFDYFIFGGKFDDLDLADNVGMFKISLPATIVFISFY